MSCSDCDFMWLEVCMTKSDELKIELENAKTKKKDIRLEMVNKQTYEISRNKLDKVEISDTVIKFDDGDEKKVFINKIVTFYLD